MDIRDATKDIIKQQNDSLENYLLEYFGDYDTAATYSHFFVIEYDEMKFETVESPMTDEYKFMCEINYRLRVRSEEELIGAGVSKPWPDEIVMLQQVEAERQGAASQNLHGV